MVIEWFFKIVTGRLDAHNKAFQTDKVAVSHLLQKAQKLRHSNFAAEQRR